MRRSPLITASLLVLTALIALGSFALRPGTAHAAACEADGIVSVNTTWGINCDLTGSVTVNAGVTLTISPGVKITSTNASARLIINGTLRADGTNPTTGAIEFTSGKVPTSQSPGDWGGITFNAGSTTNLLDYVTVKYAGGFGFPAVDVKTSALTISNSKVLSSEADGIKLTNASPSISSTQIDSNGALNFGRALDLNGSSFPTLSNLTIGFNGFDGAAINGATIPANYTWGGTSGVSKYLLTASVTVNPGVTLTIAPGTTIYVDNVNTDLNIKGALKAQGTLGGPIRFTSGNQFVFGGSDTADPGDWGQIVFDTTSSGSVLSYVTVEYGGAGIDVRNPGLDIRSSGVTILNSTVRLSLEDGIAIRNASPIISNTAVNNNGPADFGRALDLYGSSFPTLSGLSASGNSFNGIAVNGATMVSNYTWGTAGLPNYLILDDVTIATGATLTIVPNTTIYLDNPNTDLVVEGTLTAQGAAASPIHFRSGDQFTIGGSPGSSIGDWGSIKFKAGSSNSVLEFAIVEDGGGIDAGITTETDSVTIRNSTIARNANSGIRVIAGAPTIISNNFAENSGFGEYGVRNTGPAIVTATCNWWDAASGPKHSTNPSGTGQAVTDKVIFDPWLVAPSPGGECTGTNPRIYLPMIRK